MVNDEKFIAHEKDIATKQTPRFCPKCKHSHSDFKLHERRNRVFYVIIDFLVNTVESFLGRWKCSLCKATFTYYPEYALPYKRYVMDHCRSFSKAYVENDTANYQDASSAIGYTTQRQQADDRMLAKSTVWRWLSSFGSLTITTRNAFNRIRQSDPNSTVFRQISPICPGKYRSKERKSVLERALLLFTAEAEYHRIFGRSFFPDLATKFSWS